MTRTWLELLYKVIKRDICTSCGACIAACPPDFIEMVRGKPKRAIKRAACENCEICYVVCPQTGFDTRDIESEFFRDEKKKR
jgi:Pyruvate/2-oxoacid:ferredoxin oxidoreductase delta subunit